MRFQPWPKKKTAQDNLKVSAAFGFWALDVEKVEVRPHFQVVQWMSATSLGIYKDVFFVKVIENGQVWDEEPEPSRVRGLAGIEEGQHWWGIIRRSNVSRRGWLYFIDYSDGVRCAYSEFPPELRLGRSEPMPIEITKQMKCKGTYLWLSRSSHNYPLVPYSSKYLSDPNHPARHSVSTQALDPT